MWKVKFGKVVVFTSETDIEALQYALALHQSSNVSHTVYVTKPHPNEKEIAAEFETVPGDKVTAVDLVVCTLTRE